MKICNNVDKRFKIIDKVAVKCMIYLIEAGFLKIPPENTLGNEKELFLSN